MGDGVPVHDDARVSNGLGVDDCVAVDDGVEVGDGVGVDDGVWVWIAVGETAQKPVINKDNNRLFV